MIKAKLKRFSDAKLKGLRGDSQLPIVKSKTREI